MDSKELEKIFKGFVTFRNPKEIFDLHSSFLAVEILFYTCFVLTLFHALRHGGRHLYLFIAIFIHGLAVECLSYVIPDVDNFWHAQSTVMLFGQRLPLHILCFYPVLIYTASVVVSHMKLPVWSEMCAVGIATIAMDLPWDILGVKLLWWTWHDTDPNVADRFYWVPWTSFYFFAAFTSSLTLLLRFFRWLIAGEVTIQNSSFSCCRELLCSLLAGVLAVPLGVLQFILMYHVPHDLFKVPTSVCVCIYLSIFILLVWTGDRGSGAIFRLSKGSTSRKPYELLLLILIYFPFFVLTAFLAKPENIVSVGIHQPIGNCNEKVAVHTPIGMVLSKNKYLCASSYEEDYFDFHCAKQHMKEWENKVDYVICGTKFANHNEYLAIIASASFFGMFIYWQLLFYGGRGTCGISNAGQKLKIK